MIRNLLIAAAFCFCGSFAYSQDFSNKGKEFWLAYSFHVGMVNAGGAPVMTLYITSDQATSYSVEIFGGPILANGSLIANTVVAVTIPNTYFVNADGLFNGRAIHVTAAKPVVVYSFITRNAASAATLCLPTNVLGRQYFGMSFVQNANEANACSYLTIVAVEDNTNVEIIPTAGTRGGWAAGSTNVISLNKGQVYQVLGNTTGNNGVDLSGTSVRSIASGSGGCKRIAVFSGTGKIAIGCPTGSADNLYQQLYPVASWGKRFLTVPSANRPANYYRIMRSDPTTVVTLNGTVIPAASFTNGYYTFNNNIPNVIEATLPVCVSQYFTSAACMGNNNPYDPDMVILNPVEQNINKVTLVNSPLTATGAHIHNIHVVMKNSGTGISSFRFDNAVIPATANWLVHPQDPSYSYLYLAGVSQGNHEIRSDSGFNALAYGYGQAETYAYSAGANVKDLYQQIQVSTQYGIEQTPSVCKGSPFRFKISLPYRPLQLVWDLSGLPGGAGTSPSNANVTQNPAPGCALLTAPDDATYVCHDSTTFVNGKQIWWYSIPIFYTINTNGTFPVGITAQTSGSDGCGSEQEIAFDLEVSDPPVAAFGNTTPGCAAEPVQFTDQTITVKPNYRWYWDFGDGSPVSFVQNPSHTYAPGTYTVRFASITTPGCLSDTLNKTITIAPQPSATIAGTIAVCQGAPQQQITFTGTGGTLPYTFSYNINGGATQTVSTTGTATSVTLNQATTTAGTFTYNLVGIRNTPTALCSTNYAPALSATVTVNSLPTATITGTTTVCQNAAAANITFTGANGTAPYTFTYNTGTGPDQTIVTTSGNSVTLPVATTAFGVFTYNLVSVTDGSTTLCSQAQTGTVTVTVEAMPTATISTSATTACVNGTAPVITFTANGGAPPYVFTYNTGGPNQTVTSGATSNTATVTVPVTAPGTFIYTLTNVKVQSATICSNAVTGQSVSVQVSPLPTATITGTTAVCQNAAPPTITFTGANGTAPYTFSYLLNSAPQTISTTGASSTVTLTAPTTTPGGFTYTLTGVSDASPAACSNTASGAATVTVNEVPAATVSNGGTNEICLNGPAQTITFTGSGGTAPYTFTYNLNGGGNQTIVSTGNTATIPVNTGTAGTFTYNLISVRESSSTTCLTAVTNTSATVIVNSQPTVSFTAPAPYCAGQTITVTPSGTVSSGSIISYVFDFGDGNGPQTFASNTPQTVTYTSIGPKTVTLTTISDKNCPSAVFSQTFTVGSLPQAGFILPEVCLLDPFAQFTDTSKVLAPATITAWLWNFGDPAATPGNPNTSTAQNPTHTYSSVGNYNVTLTVTTNGGCQNTIMQVLTVNGGNPVSDFIVQNAGNNCSNNLVSIQNKSTITSGVITKLEIYWDNVNQPAVFDLDNDPLFDEIYTHQYPILAVERTYSIRVRAYSGGVCFSDGTRTETVHATPNVQFNAIPPVCLNNGTVTINQGTETGGVPGTGVYSGPGINGAGVFTPLAVGPGTYTLTYTFTSSFGCIDSETQTVTVSEAPIAVFSAGTPRCEDSPITFTQNSTSGAGPLTQWIWNFEGTDEPHTDGNPVTHVFANAGSYTVTLTVVTGAGCRSIAASQTITIAASPAPNFTFSASACLPNANVQFTNTTPNVSDNTYQWNFNYPSVAGNDQSTAINPQHIYTAQGPYPVRLTATNTASGCSGFIDKVVNTIHPAPTASFDFSAPAICEDQSVGVIDASSGADGSITSWTWSYGDNSTAMGQNPPPHTYTSAGTFDVKLSIINSFGCTDDSTRSYKVYGYPVVNAGPDLFVLEGGTSVLDATATGERLTYNWTANTPATYLNSTTILKPVTAPLSDVTYTLTATSAGLCSSDDEVFVKVLLFPQIPNTFTPNNDNIHDTWDINYLYTYPNNRVQVFTRSGQLVFESKGYKYAWDGTKNGKPLPIDTYYYIIEPGYGRKPITGYVTILK